MRSYFFLMQGEKHERSGAKQKRFGESGWVAMLLPSLFVPLGTSRLGGFSTQQKRKRTSREM